MVLLVFSQRQIRNACLKVLARDEVIFGIYIAACGLGPWWAMLIGLLLWVIVLFAIFSDRQWI